jgi:hypothetical protein
VSYPRPPRYPLLVTQKKLEENEKCEASWATGVRCNLRARYGEPEPRWCSNHDPSDEGAIRRARAGLVRHPGTPEAKKRIDARVEGTLDQVVRSSLAAKAECERSSKLAGAAKDSLGQARLANAAANLGRLAVQALKARGMVGDILPKGSGPPKASESAPGATAAPEGVGLDDWIPGRVDA